MKNLVPLLNEGSTLDQRSVIESSRHVSTMSRRSVTMGRTYLASSFGMGWCHLRVLHFRVRRSCRLWAGARSREMWRFPARDATTCLLQLIVVDWSCEMQGRFAFLRLTQTSEDMLFSVMASRRERTSTWTSLLCVSSSKSSCTQKRTFPISHRIVIYGIPLKSSRASRRSWNSSLVSRVASFRGTIVDSTHR
jgi:hypothetical protein